MEKKNFQKILIIQTAFIGDLILATGVIEKLHQFYPQAEIDIIVKKENREVLAFHPYIHEIISFDKSKKVGGIFTIVSKIRKRKYDLVVNLHRFAATGLITFLSKGKIKVGYDKNPLSFTYTKSFPHIINEGGNTPHEIERNHALIAEFTDSVPAKPKIYWNETDLKVVKIYQKQNYICIAPSSVWYTKQLPEEKWVDFIKSIPEEFTVNLIGAVGDISLCERIKNNSRRNNVKVLAGSLSIKQSAALMKGALMNFVNDSAPLHIASAANAPVTAIFCSTVPVFGFGPLSDHSRIVQVDYPLECKPCGLHGYKHCPLGHFKCGNDIKISYLLENFKEVVSTVG